MESYSFFLVFLVIMERNNDVVWGFDYVCLEKCFFYLEENLVWSRDIVDNRVNRIGCNYFVFKVFII